MTEQNLNNQPHELGEALHKLVLSRVSAINGKVLARLATVSDDLDGGHHLAALGGLDGLLIPVHLEVIDRKDDDSLGEALTG